MLTGPKLVLRGFATTERVAAALIVYDAAAYMTITEKGYRD